MKPRTPQWTTNSQSEYLRAAPSNISDDQRNILKRPVWQPPKWGPARHGADDHKQYSSRGVKA